MVGVNTLLNERLKRGKKTSKMTAMARQSSEGNRSGFAGIFGVAKLSDQEKEVIEEILLQYGDEKSAIESDLESLVAISAEVKAINNQAALLHGERILKARDILKAYAEGAFTSWLMTTYGNRQTPYNFLQYYEFYTAIPKNLRPRIEMMPRQAVYTLASREGDIEVKKEIIEDYDGETKEELMEIIRDAFPLNESDKRKQNRGDAAVATLEKLCGFIAKYRSSFNKKQKKKLAQLIETLQDLV